MEVAQMNHKAVTPQESKAGTLITLSPLCIAKVKE